MWATPSKQGPSACQASRWTGATRGPRARRRVSYGRGAQGNDPFDVEGRAGEDEERVHRGEPAQLHLAQTGNRLEPRERPFDARPCMLTHRVARVSRGAGIDRAPPASGVVLR